jgi:hypothetical protein
MDITGVTAIIKNDRAVIRITGDITSLGSKVVKQILSKKMFDMNRYQKEFIGSRI